jgi:hypothetical protein
MLWLNDILNFHFVSIRGLSLNFSNYIQNILHIYTFLWYYY